MTSPRPKYSVVIPILNGADTFRHSLKEMLKIDRDDIEWVISDNHSEDDLQDVVREMNDPRVHVYVPPERLPIGKNLEFAYCRAQGEWQGHMGDDDMIFPSRFAYMDAVMAEEKGVEVFRGEWVRYHWPDFLPVSMANTIEKAFFCGGHRVRPAKDKAVELLNAPIIPGGASWTIHRSVIEKVRARCGYFASAQHVEFFAMRAACAAAERIVELDFPVWVLGRHLNSAGTNAFSRPIPGLQKENKKFDWSFEDPDLWEYCPFQFKVYGTISLDASLAVRSKFKDELGTPPIYWIMWSQKILNDLVVMVDNNRVDRNAVSAFQQKVREMADIMSKEGPPPRENKPVKEKPVTLDGFGWRAFSGDLVDIQTVADVPRWVESTFPRHFVP